MKGQLKRTWFANKSLDCIRVLEKHAQLLFSSVYHTAIVPSGGTTPILPTLLRIVGHKRNLVDNNLAHTHRYGQEVNLQ